MASCVIVPVVVLSVVELAELDEATVRKRDDGARMPYRRALESDVITAEWWAAFEAERDAHGSLSFRRRSERELDRLWDLADAKKPVVDATTGSSCGSGRLMSQHGPLRPILPVLLPVFPGYRPPAGA